VGLIYIIMAMSGFFLSTPLMRYGIKKAIIFSLGGSALGIVSLFISVVLSDIAWASAIIGAVLAGIAISAWWAVQGMYFELICLKIDKHLYASSLDVEADVQKVRMELSAQWTIIYLLADLFIFGSISLLLYVGVSIAVVLACLALLGIITTLLGFTFESVESSDTDVSSKKLTYDEWMDEILRVPTQFRNDVRVTLLLPFDCAFGTTTAMFAYYVNLYIISDSNDLGVDSLGVFSALSDLVAMSTAYPYSYISNNYRGGQTLVMQFGSFSFVMCGLIVLSGNLHSLQNWTAMCFAKGFYGLGRGVFEGVSRAVYAQMFTGKDLAAAFSGQTLAVGFAGGICFFVFNAVNSKSFIAAIVTINAVVAIVCFQILVTIDSKKVVSWDHFLSNNCSFCLNYEKKENDKDLKKNNIEINDVDNVILSEKLLL
jgi:hypothetical protein